MLRVIKYVLVAVLLASPIVAQQVNQKDFIIIKLQSQLWVQLTTVIGQQPMQVYENQRRVIAETVKIVEADCDSATVAKLKAAGLPVNWKNKDEKKEN